MFDGRLHAQKLEETLTTGLPMSAHKGSKLLIIQIGDNAASEKYINLKLNLCQKVGVTAYLAKLDPAESDDALFARITTLVNSPEVGGCIIQLPLPRMSLNSALDLIPLEKDIDLLSSKSMDQYYAGNFQKLPPVVRAVDYFTKVNDINLQNKAVTVIGFGNLVGKPVGHFLSSLGAKVAVLDDYKTGQPITGDLILLSAGVPHLVNGENIASGSSVIDFGSSVLDGKTVGDLNLNSSLDHLSNVSPSPGGMGPLVVRFLVMNFLGI